MSSDHEPVPSDYLPSEIVDKATAPLDMDVEAEEHSAVDQALSLSETIFQPLAKNIGTQTDATVIELFKRYVTRDWVTSVTGPSLPIHPSFTKGDIVLVSSDNVAFAFPLGVLAYRSLVFRGLAELPRSEDSSRVLPITMASAKTLEILLARLHPDHSNRLVTVPSVEVLDELLAVIDAFDFRVSIIKAAVYQSDLNVGIKYAFASAYDPANENKWAVECLDVRLFSKCEQWAQHPEAHRTLEELFEKWQAASTTFVKAYERTPVNGHDDFGKRCRKQPCEGYKRGEWSSVKTVVGILIAYAMMDSPKSDRGLITTVCAATLGCRTCEHRLAMHGAVIWKEVVESGSWRR